MSINFGKPATTDNYSTGVLSEIVAGRIALAQMLDSAYAGTLTATPTGAKRLQSATGLFEMYNGSSWAALPMGYAQLSGDTFTGAIAGTSINLSGRLNTIGTAAEAIRIQPSTVNSSPFISFYTDTGAGLVRRAYLQYSSGTGAGQGVRLVNDDTNDVLVIAGAGGTGALQFYDSTVATYQTVWHAGNLDPSTYAPLASPAFTGTITGSAGNARFNGAIYGSLGIRYSGAYGGAGPNSAADEFVIESASASAAGMSILAPSTGYGAIFFGDEVSNSSGQLRYVHSTDTLSSYTAGVLRSSLSAAGLDITGAITATSESCSMNGLLVGYRGVPSLASTATATTAARGKVYKQTANHTVPASVFAADDAYAVYNNSASAINLTQGSGLTLRKAGTTTTGTLTLAPRGWATMWFVSATEAVVSGPGVA